MSVDKEYFINLLKTAGPHMALVIFFVWQGAKREERQELRIDKLETYIKTELKQLVEKNQEVIKDNSNALREK